MSTLKLGLVGVGKIVRDQHLPAIDADPRWRLAATADPFARLDGVPAYDSLAEMLEAQPELDAVAICTPTHLRHSQARLALEAGKAVLLEKPPGATLSEVEDLQALAEARRLTLFAAWHSRFAPGVAQAKQWLAERRIQRVVIEWREDVRVWHPGQAWIWQPGGMGVFDPGINALSIATEILPRAFFLREGQLAMPDNCQTPIAATLRFQDADEVPLEVTFDFRHQGDEVWDIHIECDDGRLSLTQGGCRLSVADRVLVEAPEREYPGLYAHFAELVDANASDVDVAPLRHVADAFLYAHRQRVAAFSE
ncbi:Gfo/Idh/MocA family oxidoreductase [Halomonas sp. ML-15]|uniref:Gfo/Idh/MocA family protein n=1 Tax=Halomonas sp. ML-15 TaxID=2773305 RepID=UPI001746205C|nr:Gfo/Idh/MocA family oxidoreductase [Halomonas sp. ML-15]MBD3896824.1 Gfo/Idh/MocA family oxidoreductase [Halomonas sp. ML-15]